MMRETQGTIPEPWAPGAVGAGTGAPQAPPPEEAGQEPPAEEPAEELLEVLDLPVEDVLAIALRVTLVLAVGFPLLLLASRWARRTFEARFSPQWGLVTGKAVFYVGLALLLVSALRELGIGLAPLLGAAGIVGIAVGFASQTSVSNMISGLFLIAEQPFAVDDIVEVDTTVGRVLSIDLMSVKIRTFDNRYVRIPNETLIKTQVTTITRFPIRRMDINVGVAYRENVERVRGVLLEVAAANPDALVEPAPTVWFDGFGASSVDLRLTVWATKENFWDLRNALQEEVKARFDREDIEIPFPHRTLYTGSVTEAFPLRLGREAGVTDRDEAAGEPTGEPPGPAGDSQDGRGSE